MSLLTICQQVARSIPVKAPTVIVGSSDETSSLLLSRAQAEGKALQRAHNWLALVKEHTFVTVSGTANYDLPSDFHRIENQTLWDRSDFQRIRGPLSAQEWQVFKSSNLGSGVVHRRFRIRDVSGTVKFSIDPTPSASGETLVFEYVSANWCQSSGGTSQSAWTADTDTGVLDEYLIELGVLWRTLRRLGMEASAEMAEYNVQMAQAIARDGGAPILSIARRPTLALT